MRNLLTCALAATAWTLAASPILGDHIPGHDNADPVFPAPIPGQADFNGGGAILFATLIGPPNGTTIYDTNLDITYVSDGVTPASDLVIVISMNIDGQSHELDITGADLGFGGGSGTFEGTLQTDLFNGVISGGLPPNSTINLQIGSTTGGVNGTAYFVDSFIYLTVQKPGPVPALSAIGLTALVLALLAAGAVVIIRRARRHAGVR
jgi:hypothetical protein